MARKFIDLTGNKYTNVRGYTYEVSSYFYVETPSRGKRVYYNVEFLNTGTVAVAEAGNVKAGKVKDVYQPHAYGLACLGNPGAFTRQDRQRWDGMLERCYSPDSMPCYAGCTVSERWLCFEYFLEDLKAMPNYGKPLHDLDKDLLEAGNKIYCPEFCDLVPRGVNRTAGNLNR